MKRVMRTQREKGFVLIATAIGIVGLVAILGLAVDLARMYIAKNELQAYTDSAALAAARLLNGTDAHLALARNTAQNYPNRWNLGNETVASVEVGFAQNRTGPYDPAPSSAAGYRFVRVKATGQLGLFFLPVIETITSTQMMQAEGRAGQIPKTTPFTVGLIPYSPEAYCAVDCSSSNDFGFTRGKQYTLRWPPPNKRTTPGNWCQGDQEHNYVSSSTSNDRGFIDIGDGTNAAALRDAILNNAQSHSLEVGDTIVTGSGNKGVESAALRERVEQDTDTTSATSAVYDAEGKGNDRRYVITAINDPATDKILGFGLFFLPLDVCGSSNTNTCCAEYVGPAIYPGSPGAGPAGAYEVKLFY